MRLRDPVDGSLLDVRSYSSLCHFVNASLLVSISGRYFDGRSDSALYEGA